MVAPRLIVADAWVVWKLESLRVLPWIAAQPIVGPGRRETTFASSLVRRSCSVTRRPVNSTVRRLSMYIMKILILVLIGFAIVVAQNKPDASGKYGTPVSETYMARSGIYVTVVRNDAGVACGLRIAPAEKPGYLLGKSGEQTIPYATLTSLIDEIVPLTERGKLIRRGVLNTNCLDLGRNTPPCEGNGDIASYENVTIFFARSAAKDKKRYAEVRWNKSECVD